MILPVKLFQKAANGIRFFTNSSIVVLLYHRVTRLAEDPFQLAVDPGNFREQMCFLAKHYPVVRFEDARFCRKGVSFIVTFDDGYRDNFTEALPVLEEFRIPATFFIASENVRLQRNFWWDELEFLSKGGSPDRFFKLQKILKESSSFSDRERLFEQTFPGFREKLKAFPLQVLSESELRTFSQSELVTIGSHTMNHCRLSSLDESEQRREMEGGRAYLREITGKNVDVFSYPFGTASDYDRTSVKICGDLGFQRVAANFSHPWYSGDSPLEIPRTLVRNWSGARFCYEIRKSFFR